MKIRILLLTVVLLGSSSCSEIPVPPSLKSVYQAAESGVFEGIDENTEAELVISSEHHGPYAQVKQLNFIIENGIYKGMEANIILVQYEKTDAWQPIRLMVNDNGVWQEVAQKKLVAK